jgi:hypothetical protein
VIYSVRFLAHFLPQTFVEMEIMKQVLIASLIASGVLGLSACASNSTENAGQVSESVANDAFGLPRQRPGELALPEDYAGVRTPYGGDGARRTCRNAAADIAQLSVLLGPDAERPAEEGESEKTRMERAREFTSHVRYSAPGAAADVARDAVVGLNPARPVVRFVGRAGRIEAEARRERELLVKQRAWLRGAFDAWGCNRRVMIRAFDRVGIELADSGLVESD